MKQKIIDKIFDNLEYYRTICSQAKDTKDKLLKAYLPDFRDIVEEQYKSSILNIISVELSKDLGCSYQDVIEVIEDNFKELFE